MAIKFSYTVLGIGEPFPTYDNEGTQIMNGEQPVMDRNIHVSISTFTNDLRLPLSKFGTQELLEAELHRLYDDNNPTDVVEDGLLNLVGKTTDVQ